MASQNQRSKAVRKQFLLSFFDGKKEYAEVEVNGFYLVRQISGESGNPVIAIYTKKKFHRYKMFQAKSWKNPQDYERKASK